MKEAVKRFAAEEKINLGGSFGSAIYAVAPCRSGEWNRLNGWNVPVGTLLSYSISFASGTLLSDLGEREVKETVLSHAGQFVVSVEEGLRIQGTRPKPEIGKDLFLVEAFEFVPKSTDTSKRCAGFPPFNPHNFLYYGNPLHEFEWRPEEAEMFAARLDQLATSVSRSAKKGIVLIYLPNATAPESIEPAVSAWRQGLKDTSSANVDVKVVFAGYSTYPRTETYDYYADSGYLPPSPQPDLPCFDPRCYKEIE